MSTARTKTHIVAFIFPVEYPNDVPDQKGMLEDVTERAFRELMLERIIQAHIYSEDGERMERIDGKWTRTYHLTPASFEALTRVIKREEVEILLHGKEKK